MTCQPVSLLARLSLLFCTLLCVGAFTTTGCSLQLAEPSPASEPEEPAPGEPDVPPPSPVSCDDDGDCGEGETCHANVCRDACGNDADCGGAMPFCSLDNGVCVECATSDQCDGGEVCRALRCLAACTTDDDCDDGETCEDSTCVAPECTNDDHCADGEACVEGNCGEHEVTPPVCGPGAMCANNAVLECDGNGAVISAFDCGDLFCVERDGVANCEEQALLCEPNALGCLDENTAFVCNADGSEQTELPCNDNQLCDDGVCRTLVCPPGETFCNDDGARVTCNADGSALSDPVMCSDGQVCMEGACVDEQCAPGATRCAGDVLLTCNSEGDGHTSTPCLDDASFCTTDDGDARCAPQVCVPDTAVCAADGQAVLTCNARGSDEERTPCADGDVCEAGVCDTPCLPQCGDRECGVDPICGTPCGTCDTGDLCSPDGRCEGEEATSLQVELTSTTPMALRLTPDSFCSPLAVGPDVRQPNWDGVVGASAGDPRLEASLTRLDWEAPSSTSYERVLLGVQRGADGVMEPVPAAAQIVWGDTVVADVPFALWPNSIGVVELLLHPTMGIVVDDEHARTVFSYQGDCVDCALADCVEGAVCTDTYGECVTLSESTPAECSDGDDNDGDGYRDCQDFDCQGIGVCGAENTEALCTDGMDNDDDGYQDCRDFNCGHVYVCTLPEDSPETCSDTFDNDGDGYTDCDDFACHGVGDCPVP